MYVVAEIGCLECGHSTALYGPFETEAEARLAYPKAVERVYPFGDEPHEVDGDWFGDCQFVIYRMTDAGNAPQNRSE